MKRTLTLICSFILGLLELMAQNVVYGNVKDSLGNPLNDVIVSVITERDSAVIAYTYTAGGEFMLRYSPSAADTCQLNIHGFGFEELIFNIPKDSTAYDAGDIRLIQTYNSIEASYVVIETEYAIQSTQGKTIYSIPQIMSENSIDLYALLQKIPDIIIEGDDVKVLGKGNSAFTINGRPLRPNELKSLSPKDVLKISIDRMPSSKYSTSVKSVIDIKTKHSSSDRIRLLNDFRFNNEPQNTSGIYCTNQIGNLSSFLGYSYLYARKRYTTEYETDIYNLDNSISQRIYTQEPFFTSNTHTLILGPEYKFNPKHNIDLQYQLSVDGSSSYNYETFDLAGIESDIITGCSALKENMHDIILRYRYDNDTTSFDVNIGYSSYLESSSIDNNEEITNIRGGKESLHNNYNSEYDSRIIHMATMFEHSFNINEISIGVNLAKIWNSGKIVSETYRNESNYVEEFQSSVWATFGQVWKRLNWKFGIRGEYLYRQSNENKAPFLWLPTCNVAYNFTPDFIISTYYRRYTVHPTVDERDPILHYVNKYEYMQGNPHLKSYVENECTLRIDLPFNLSLQTGYNFAKDPIIMMDDIYDLSKQQTILTYHNFPSKKNLIVDASWSYRKSNYALNINGSYNQYFSKLNFNNSIIELKKPMWGLRLYQSIIFAKIAELEMSINYNTAYDALYSRMGNKYDLDLSLTLSIIKRKLNIVIACNNLLYNDEESWEMYKQIMTHNINKMFDRQLRIGISYNFNNYKHTFKKNYSNSDIIDRIY